MGGVQEFTDGRCQVVPAYAHGTSEASRGKQDAPPRHGKSVPFNILNRLAVFLTLSQASCWLKGSHNSGRLPLIIPQRKLYGLRGWDAARVLRSGFGCDHRERRGHSSRGYYRTPPDAPRLRRSSAPCDECSVGAVRGSVWFPVRAAFRSAFAPRLAPWYVPWLPCSSLAQP